MWRLLHKKMEPAPVNFCQPAGRFRYHARGAGTVIDQRHLTQERTGACSFHDEIAHHDIRVPFEQYIHFIAAFSFAKKKITGPEVERAGILTKKLCRIHELSVISEQRLQRTQYILPSYVCVTTRWCGAREQILRVLRGLRG